MNRRMVLGVICCLVPGVFLFAGQKTKSPAYLLKCGQQSISFDKADMLPFFKENGTNPQQCGFTVEIMEWRDARIIAINACGDKYVDPLHKFAPAMRSGENITINGKRCVFMRINFQVNQEGTCAEAKFLETDK